MIEPQARAVDSRSWSWGNDVPTPCRCPGSDRARRNHGSGGHGRPTSRPVLVATAHRYTKTIIENLASQIDKYMIDGIKGRCNRHGS